MYLEPTVPTINISKPLFDRLANHAVAFDQPENVIERILEFYEAQKPHDHQAQRQASESAVHVVMTNKEIQQKIAAIAKTLPTSELDALCTKDHSKRIFDISFPLLVRVPSATGELEKREIVKVSDVNRWTWKYEFERDGYSYAVCTQWYRRNDILVHQWLLKHG